MRRYLPLNQRNYQIVSATEGKKGRFLVAAQKFVDGHKKAKTQSEKSIEYVIQMLKKSGATYDKSVYINPHETDHHYRAGNRIVSVKVLTNSPADFSLTSEFDHYRLAAQMQFDQLLAASQQGGEKHAQLSPTRRQIRQGLQRGQAMSRGGAKTASSLIPQGQKKPAALSPTEQQILRLLQLQLAAQQRSSGATKPSSPPQGQKKPAARQKLSPTD